MPPRGGISAKLGSRFEDLVAVWRLLELVGDRFSAARMRIEQPGEDGFEWWVEHADDSRTYAQVKRQQAPDREWDIATLASREVLMNFAVKLRADPQAKCEFISTLSATHLQDLVESARHADSATEFETHFVKGDKKGSWEKICTTWVAEVEEAWQLLRRITVTWISEPALDRAVRDRIAALITGDPDDIIDFLLGFIVRNLAQTIEAEDVWTFLREKGLTSTDWRQDASVRTQIAAATDRYRHRLDEDRGPLPSIARSAATEIAALLIDPEGPSVITVVAEAGMGKSTLLGQVLEHLDARPGGPTDQHGVVLALRLDQLVDFGDARALGEILRLPDSPALVLSRVVGMSRAVLVLDQLDAFSAASGRKSAALEAVSELLRQARSVGVRVVMACRAFDLDFDPRLSSLAGISPNNQAREGHHIEKLGALSDDEVEHALAAVNVDPSALNSSLLSLLATPLHLQMLATLQNHGRLDAAGISTRLQLFDRFFNNVCVEVRSRQPNTLPEAASEQLAAVLSERQELSAPLAALNAYRASLPHLISAGWFREESGRVQFGHEAYFDYAYAYRHMSSGMSLLDLLRNGEQRLFRRSQVRQILTLEREQDCPQYVRDLGDLLGASDVRPHIKQIVIGLTTQVTDPTIQEWQALQRLGDPQFSRLAEQAHALACQAPAFGRLLLDEDVVGTYLTDAATPALGMWMCRLLARLYPDEIAALLRPHVAEPSWAYRLLDLLNGAPLQDSEDLVELFEALLDSGAIDDAVRSDSPDADFFMLLLGMTGLRAERGARLLAAWVRRRLAVLIECGIFSQFPTGPDDEDSIDESTDECGEGDAELYVSVWLADSRSLLEYTPSAEQALSTLAHDDPRAYVRHVLPVVREVANRTREGQIDERGEYCKAFRQPALRNVDLNPTDGLLIRLAEAMRTAVERGDTEAHAAIRVMVASPLQVDQFLVAVGFAAGHADLRHEALAWLETGPHSLAQGWAEEPVGLSAAVLAFVCRHFPPEITAAAQERAANYATEYEQHTPGLSGRSAHLLLRTVPDEDLTDFVRARKRELASRFSERLGAARPMDGFVDFALPTLTWPAIGAMSDKDLLARLAASAAELCRPKN